MEEYFILGGRMDLSEGWAEGPFSTQKEALEYCKAHEGKHYKRWAIAKIVKRFSKDAELQARHYKTPIEEV